MITTHVLDVAAGCPASGLAVTLDARRGDQWTRIGEGRTDTRGRLESLAAGQAIPPGVYRLTFDTGAYQRTRKQAAFFPEVSVVFEIADGDAHHHVPLLLSPFGYSTYKGT